jgi:heme-degrading monooxygenase HmoA
MTVVRLIHVVVDPGQASEAERIWKEDCAPLMIKQKGCRSEQLLKCEDAPGEYISYAEWETQADIDAYRDSEAHKQVQNHSRALQGAQAVVKRYQVVS